MIHKTQLTRNLKNYIDQQVISMARQNPMMSFMKPIITRVIDKKFEDIHKAIDMIADKEGNIDVEAILTEMIDSVMNTNPFILNVPVVGDIEIGGGVIKLNLPVVDKSLVLNKSDLDILKEMLTNTN